MRKKSFTKVTAEELYRASKKPEKRCLLPVWPFSKATVKIYGDDTEVTRYEGSDGNVKYLVRFI